MKSGSLGETKLLLKAELPHAVFPAFITLHCIFWITVNMFVAKTWLLLENAMRSSRCICKCHVENPALIDIGCFKCDDDDIGGVRLAKKINCLSSIFLSMWCFWRSSILDLHCYSMYYCLEIQEKSVLWYFLWVSHLLQTTKSFIIDQYQARLSS